MPNSTTNTKTTPDEGYHVLRVEQEVNAQFGGDCGIRELVWLMVRMGWKPPTEARVNDAKI